MEKERKHNLRKLKITYYSFNVLFVAALISSFILFKLTQIRISTLFIIDLCVLLIMTVINTEMSVSGIEKIANEDLTMHILTMNETKEVIPVNPPEGISIESEGTFNMIYGNIHKNLINADPQYKVYAKLSLNGRMVEIYKDYEEKENGLVFVGYIKPEVFPYFYDLKSN